MQGVLSAATEQGGGAIESASATLAALGSKWLAADQSTTSLLVLVTNSLEAMQPLQRLPLLSATLQGLPQVEPCSLLSVADTVLLLPLGRCLITKRILYCLG